MVIPFLRQVAGRGVAAQVSVRAKQEVVQLEAERTRKGARRPVEVAESPLYGVAMLKIAMELKKQANADLDEILRGVLRRMDLPEQEFREFLARNGGLLKTIASRRGY